MVNKNTDRSTAPKTTQPTHEGATPVLAAPAPVNLGPTAPASSGAVAAPNTDSSCPSAPPLNLPNNDLPPQNVSATPPPATVPTSSPAGDHPHYDGYSSGPTFFVHCDGDITIGPMPESLIAQAIAEGMLTGAEQVQSSITKQWMPIKTLPQLNNAFRLRSDTHKNAIALAAPFLSAQLSRWGVAPVLLDIAKRKLTGTLRVESSSVVKIVSILLGQPINIVSNNPEERLCRHLTTVGVIQQDQAAQAMVIHERHLTPVAQALVSIKAIENKSLPSIIAQQAWSRMADLLMWKEGDVRFDITSVSELDATVLGGNALMMCRAQTQNMTNAEIEEFLGGPGAKIGIRAPLGEGCLPTEEQVLEHLPSSEHESLLLSQVVQKLQTTGMNLGDILRSLLMLRWMDLISVTDATPQALIDLQQKLFLPNIYDVLELEAQAPVPQLKEKTTDLQAQLSQIMSQFESTPPNLAQRLNEIKNIIDDPIELYIMSRTKFMRLDCSNSGIRDALEIEYLENSVAAEIEAGHFSQVQAMAERFKEKAPDNVSAIAYAALTRAHISADDNEQKQILQELTEVSQQFPAALELHIAIAQCARLVDNTNRAMRAIRAAQAIAPKDRRVLALLGVDRTTTQPAATITTTTLHATRSIAKSLAVAAYCLLFFALLWYAACYAALGRYEYYFSGTDSFWYIRRLALVGSALLGAFLIQREGPSVFIKGFGFRLSRNLVLVAVVIGTISGVLSAQQRVTGLPAIVIVLSVITVFAEQIFFTGFVTRNLLRMLPAGAAIILSGTLYGVYHLSYYSFFYETTPYWIFFWVVMVMVGAGLPYALLYAKSKSIVPPLVCHLFAYLVTMGLSIYHRSGAM